MKDPTTYVSDDEKFQHLHERQVNGFSTYDWWNFNDYLTFVIINGVKKFHEGVGHPANLTEEQWQRIIKQIVKGFKAQHRLSNFQSKNTEKDKRRWDRGSRLFIEYYTSLWD